MLEKFVDALTLNNNRHTLEQLDAMAQSRRLPHALVIEGNSAQDCTALARVLARAFLCECSELLGGACKPCRRLAAGGHPDLTELEGSGKTGAITVDAVRQARADALLVPAEAGGKVFLLPDCDSMKPEAQNAFLKVFEEPPDRVMFVMTCRSRMSLLETIRSRACIVRLESQEDDRPPEEIAELAERFAAALCEPNDGAAVVALAYFSRDRKHNAQARRELSAMTQLLRGIFRQALFIGAGAGGLLDGRSPAAELIARTLPPDKIDRMTLELDGIEAAVKANVGLPLLTASMVARLRK